MVLLLASACASSPSTPPDPSPCGLPFSSACQVSEEQCRDPRPTACSVLGDLQDAETVAGLVENLAAGSFCGPVHVEYCPASQYFVYAEIRRETSVLGIFDAATGECVAGAVTQDFMSNDSPCRYSRYPAWTGPDALWESCAEEAYSTVVARSGAGCDWLWNGECEEAATECITHDLL